VRTTLELDDDLMRALLDRHPGLSKRAAVESAIREYLATDATSHITSLAGGFPIEDVSAELRSLDRRT